VHIIHTFLSLVGYYRHFIQDYSSIAAPLMHLLRKDVFQWGSEAETTFYTL
jgi:hypothetical protein